MFTNRILFTWKVHNTELSGSRNKHLIILNTELSRLKQILSDQELFLDRPLREA